MGALPLLSRSLDLPSNGTALQRADVYGYRTADYAMSTTQAYQPGAFGHARARRDSRRISVAFAGHRLDLDFTTGTRTSSQA